MQDKLKNRPRAVPLRDCLPIKHDLGCFIPDSDFRKWIYIETWGQA